MDIGCQGLDLNIVALAVDDPEARGVGRSEDREAVIDDLGDARMGGRVDGCYLDGHIGRNGLDIIGEVDDDLAGFGDGCPAPVKDGGFGALQACVDQVPGGIDGVGDDERLGAVRCYLETRRVP